MAGNTIGTLFSFTSLFGRIACRSPRSGAWSMRCRMALAESDIPAHRRLDGTSRHVTQRREPDTVEILSACSKGVRAPIALLIRNVDSRSKDYANIADTFRPACRLHVLQKVRASATTRGVGELGARNCRACRGRRDREETAGRALLRSPDAARPQRRSVRKLRACRRQSLFHCQCDDGAGARSLHGSVAQVRRIRSARASR